MVKKDSEKGTKKVRARKPTPPGTKAVSFRLDSPEANSVTLVGDFNNWHPNARQLRRGKEGVWKGILRLTPGVYQYKFVVDGSEWWEDPENPKRAPNNYGTMNSICEVL